MTTSLRDLDFDHFHEYELPKLLLEGRSSLAAEEAARQGALALRIDGGNAYTYQPRNGGLEIVSGDASADTVVGLDQESWEGLVHDLESPQGLIYRQKVKKLRGDLMHFVAWEPPLRALYRGIPIHAPEAPLLSAEGAILDPALSFRLHDDAREMTAFMHAAGYILIKNVFDEAEVADLLREAEIVGERAVEGDQKSWWGKTAEGEVLLSRVIAAAILPGLRSLPRDPRILRIGEIPDLGLDGPSQEEDGVSVLWKYPNAVEGITNLPWHRDCGMGGHAVNCPGCVCQIYLTNATPEMGELRVLPGSHRSSYAFKEPYESVPGAIGVPAEAGDVSLHFGDLMHGTPPPTGEHGPYRISLLLGFPKHGAYNHRGERHYNDVLLGSTDGQIDSMSKVADRD